MIINSVKQIIKPDSGIVIEVQESSSQGGGKITLEETAPDAKLKKVEIRGIETNQTFAFKLDVEGKRISEYLNHFAPKINKACDGIIFTQINGQYYVFICEMKSEKPNEQECIIKFRNSRLFVEFVLNIIKEFYLLAEQVEFKYILFDVKRNSDKTTTKLHKIEPNSMIDSDDNTELLVYRVHRLATSEFLNIRHLRL